MTLKPSPRSSRRRSVRSKGNKRRVRRTNLELHLLSRPKLGNETGPSIHWGVGIYHPTRMVYLQVFHSAPNTQTGGDALVSPEEFWAGQQVFRHFLEEAPGAWSRLMSRVMHPQPWSPFQNCQHLATWIIAGRAYSPTMQAIGAAISIAAVTVIAVTTDKDRARKQRRPGGYRRLK